VSELGDHSTERFCQLDTALTRDFFETLTEPLTSRCLEVCKQVLDEARLSPGDVEAVIESAAYRAFYMHGTGHWLGRDVHDVGEVLALDEPPIEQRDGYGARVLKKPSRVLRPGMVITVEPGLYVRPAEGVPERFWNIGIRIEDDVLVTETGCEVLTHPPRTVADIEDCMRG